MHRIKAVLQSLKRFNVELLYDPAVPLLSMYPKDLKQGLKQILVCQCSLQRYSQYLIG